MIDDDDDDVQELGISVHVSSDHMKLVHFSRDVSFVRLIAKCSTACTTKPPSFSTVAQNLTHGTRQTIQDTLQTSPSQPHIQKFGLSKL